MQREWAVPTQNCVLAHITTQIAALKKGAPMALMFQSLAGTQKGNEAFGISEEILNEGYELMKTDGTSTGPNFMYFETGQGSEVSLAAHFDVDMQTLESRTYGYARRWKPFMVNNVSGFIGPETLYDGRQLIRADLEDLFMGKLHGLPMGIAPTYTNHMDDVANIENLLPALQQGLALKNISSGQPIFVKKSRVWLQDDVAKIVNCQIAIILIGERPGLNTDESLSAYIIYRPNEQTVEADRTVISNIHRAGLAPTEAGAYLADLLEDMLRLKCSGVEFSKKRNV